MDIWVTGIVMAGLGYWAAYLRLYGRCARAKVTLEKAEKVLAGVKLLREELDRALQSCSPTDRSKGDGEGLEETRK